MQIPFQPSEPGAPQSNAIAECNVEDYIKGARATCHHAGLPSCFWTYAGPMHCIHSNNRKRGGKIPCVERCGREWEGQEIPFGAGV
eukprot:10149198-Karenia_brevis.AAC.1